MENNYLVEKHKEFVKICAEEIGKMKDYRNDYADFMNGYIKEYSLNDLFDYIDPKLLQFHLDRMETQFRLIFPILKFHVESGVLAKNCITDFEKIIKDLRDAGLVEIKNDRAVVKLSKVENGH